MLRQIKDVRQSSGEGRKQWFNSSELDLFLWFDDRAKIISFHLIYAKSEIEKALTWNCLGRTLHAIVDDGARPGRYPSSPIMTGQTPIDKIELLRVVGAEMQGLDASVVALVISVIENFDAQ